jgi:hypothetical protein
VRVHVLVAAVVSLGAPALAGPTAGGNPAEITQRLEAIASKSTHTASDAPAFAFTGNLSLDHPANLDEATMGFPDTAVADPKKTVVVFADPDTAWISTHLGEHSDWSITASIPGTSQLDAMDEGVVPTKLGRDVKGADEVAKLFESTIPSPKAFTDTFSPRKDVVMFGSELPERYVGAKAKATLLKWNFAFGLRDGLRAGMSRSGTVAWVAANVDGKSLKHPNTTPVPYRMFVIYEKAPAGWKVVQIQFSTSV